MSGALDTLDQALELGPGEPGRLAASIVAGWDIRGVPHGGYLLALLAKAAMTVTDGDHPDPLSISATYLAAPAFGAADITVEVVRSARRHSTVEVGLEQGGQKLVRASVTLGDLTGVSSETLVTDAAQPTIPGPEHCPRAGLSEQPGAMETMELHRRIDLRLDPSVGFAVDRPSGTPEINGWLALADGQEPDPLALLVFSDGAPPSIFEARGREIGHVPTMQLTTHLLARPVPGWIQFRFRTRVVAGRYVDEDGELWDSSGQLVATARQLALVR